MRKLRKLRINATYHVVARANRQENIFEKNQFKELFLSILKEAKLKYKFQIINFCIMDNHIHLMIKPDENECLSKIMQWVLSVFAVKYNKIFKYLGHVFYDRFKSKIIDDIKQMIDTFHYITDNPVKAGIVINAQDYFYNGINFIKSNIFDIIEPPSPFLNLRNN